MSSRIWAERERAGPSYQPLVLLLVGVAVGTVVDRYWPIAAIAWWIVAAAALAVWLLLWLRGWLRSASLLLLVAAAAVAGARHHYHWRQFADSELARVAREAPQPVCLRAVLLAGPRRIPAPAADHMRVIPRGDQTQLRLRVTQVRDGGRWRVASGRTALLVEGHVSGVHAGDRLQIFGQLYGAARPQNPGEYDFAAHLRTQRELCGLRSGYPDCVAVTQRGGRWSPRRLLEEARRRSSEMLWRQVGGDRTGLAAAVLLGAREGVDRLRIESFFKTGTIHLLAISGLHVGILAFVFFLAVRTGLLPRRSTLLAIMVLAAFYALLTDARPSVVRASILIVVTCVGLMYHRPPLSFNSLAIAALCVLAWNPGDLFRSGAQLSFLAVATLVAFGPWLVARKPTDPLDRLIARTRPWPVRWAKGLAGWVWRITAVGAAIWLVALPLAMYRFHLVSLAGLLINPVLWIPMVCALLAGFGSLLLGWLIPPLGGLCGGLCHGSLSLIDAVVSWTSSRPGSHFWTAGPPLWWVLGFYLGLAVVAAAGRWRPPLRWCVTVLVVWIAVGMIPPQWRAWTAPAPQERPLACTFASVGAGTAALLELPGGQTILYDAGRLGSPTAGTRSISALLWSRGISHLDAIVISHADADHYNALPGLLERFSVGVVYVSPVMFRGDSPSLAQLRRRIEAAGVPLREVYGGDLLRTDGPARIEVLHPPRRGVTGSDNANSIVLAVEHAGRRILLPGDLESPGLEAVMDELPVDADVLMAPHHGSARSNPAGFARWCTPEFVVISGGRTPDPTAAREAFEAAGSQVLHTARHGAVRVTIGPAGVTVQPWRRDK